MRAFPAFLLAASVLASSACTSNPAAPRPAAAATTEALPEAVTAPPAPGSTGGTDDHMSAEHAEHSDAEDDVRFASPVISDPWERFNRSVHAFNNLADRFVLRPLAVGYERSVPEGVRSGVSRFFANLKMPVTVVNQALQGRPGDAAESIGRFAVNTTVGLIGVFDPATRLGLPEPDNEDFGQTLAAWGWHDSRYLVLPLLGPRTLRDTLAIAGDLPLSPISHVQDSSAASALLVMQALDLRAHMLPLDAVRADALDDYLFVRDAWSQHRRQQILQDAATRRD